MDPSDAFGDFLKSRRARITPSQAGLPAYGTNRRVPGLRREEVAMLAGISAEYYVRLERGSVRGVSEDVLDGLARALQLDDAERDHLFHLARATTTSTRRARRAPQERVRPSVQRILDVLVAAPAFVVNSRGEILAANVTGEALYSDLYAEPLRPVNTVRFIFLNPKAREFFLDWDDVAEDAIGILRAQAGRDPYDRQLTDLIGELATRSDQFRVRWAAHEVRRHRTGTKRFHHPVVGDLSLNFESLDLPGDPGQKLVVYTAEPSSPSQQAIDLLASWVTTPASHEDGPQASDALEADRPRKP